MPSGQVDSAVGRWAGGWARRPALPVLVAFYAAYVLTGGFSEGLALIPGVAIRFWPPAGLFVAALLLSRRLSWPWWVAAGCAAELTCNLIWFHNPFHLAVVYFAANAATAVAAAVLIGLVTPPPFRLESPRELLAFVLLGAGVAPVVSATAIAATDAALGKHPFATAWPLVWLGDATGLLVTTPLAVTAARVWQQRTGIRPRRLAEAVVLAGLLFGVAVLGLRGYLPTVYVALPLVLWAAVRFHLPGAASAVALLVLTTAAHTAAGRGEFAGHPAALHANLVELQTFLGVTAVSALVVAVLAHQHRRALLRLRQANADLETRVAGRTADLQRSEQRLRLFVENAPAAIAMFDQHMRYLGVSHRWQTDYQLTAEVVGRSHYEVFNVPERWKESHKRALAGEVVRADDDRYVRPDGAVRWQRWEVRPWRDAGGAVGGVIIATEDITARKQAEEALRASEERYRGIFEQMLGGVAEADLTGRLLRVSDRFCQIVGRGRDELLGLRMQDITHPDDLPRNLDPFARCVRDGQPFEIEKRYVRPDGSAVWVHNSVSLVRDERGRPQAAVAVSVDITVLKRAEEAVKASEAHFRTLADASPAILWQTAPDGGCTFMSREWYELTGQTPAEAMGLGWTAACHPDDRAAAGREFLAANARQQAFALDYRLRQRDGSYRWATDVGHPQFGPAGEFLGYVGFVVDITARKWAEDDLERSRRMLSTLVEQCPFGIYMVDADFRMADVNAGSLTGAFANVRPLVGRPFDEVIRVLWPEPVAADILRTFRHTLDTGEPYYSRDFVSPRADVGRTEAYEWELHRLTLPDGRHGVVCYYFDATKLRQAEQALRDDDRRKDEFLAVLAHELRNPLAPIRAAVEVLRRPHVGGPDLGRAMDIIDRQVRAMTRLIDDLLDVSRVRSGKIQLRRERVDLAAVVGAAVETSRPLIDDMGHTLTVDLPPDPVPLDADPVRLAQVLLNLLNNAAKYTERGGRIGLTAAAAGGEVVVRVTDTGIGIAADKLPTLFDLFTQVAGDADRSQGGLGIGLNLVKRLVEKHGGRIAARSDGPGRGSEFTVTLPVATTPAPAPPADSDSDIRVPTSAFKRVLVVDDNADAADSLAMLLELTGHAVRTAHDGEAAVAAADQFRPDVVLCDIGLPKLSGYEVCRRLRGQPWGRALVLVAVTGRGLEADKRTALECGFDHHLTKPVDPTAVVALLAGVT